MSLAFTNTALAAIAARLVFPDIKALAWWSIGAGVRLGIILLRRRQLWQASRCHSTSHAYHIKGAA
ncbi:hypothetical protein [Streptomyces harbinensis]|uniref:Uncharacterized protein n=1 Tax=Streptomyces harbinensis TaxID=1176198 RepID=A0A1I6WAT4_9ACTN|nr:hypothetical protein [Streptomyces harbinensis]SFT23095.1 hypothetical protein SAMN05444716_11633 [Streptomyces harbinensis]